MIVTFPDPVLAVSSDAVRQLDSGDVLPGLWTLFTKCKASLKDGRRLENISWRLWYREISAVQYAPPTPESVSPALSEKSRATANSTSPLPGQPTFRSDAFVAPSPTALPPARISSPPQIDDRYINHFSLSHGRPRSVGKLICDMLPHQITMPAKGVSLPTPMLKDYHKSSNPGSSADHVIPAIQLPSTPPDCDAPCPRVVVVDPTPSPSPHPTPPTTPVIPDMSTAAISHVSMTNLLPPLLPLPALTVAAKPPIASSLTASRPAQLPLPPPPPPPPPLPSPLTGASGPVDRLFFLHKGIDLYSPDGLEPNSSAPRPASDRASSASSSRKTAPTRNKRPPQPVPSRNRKGKEFNRHVARPRGAPNGRPPQIRRASTHDGKIRPTFNIGSMSSGSKSAECAAAEQDGKMLATAITAATTCAAPLVADPPKPDTRRRVVVANTSSEFETTDTDEGSWAEDETSVKDTTKATKEELQLRNAALEVKRFREMFAKIPKRSYSNLNRTRSGLLTQLLNPDPSMFPPNHPYRTSSSTQDLSRLPRDGRAYAQPVLHTSKSAAALPLAAPITAHVGSVSANRSTPAVDQGYRPRGRPHGQEMEADSDSGDEKPENSVQLSRSIAQERLAALVAMQRSSRTSSVTSTIIGTLPSQVTAATATMPPGILSNSLRPGLQHVATAPIPLSHPYNLPAPAAPSTPRTTRRQMLQTELSESLRRNLLWERQVSKVNVMAGMRRQSSGGPLGGLRPLTAINGNAAEATEKQRPQQQSGMVRHRSWADDYHSKGW